MEVLLCWAHLALPGFVPRAAPQEQQWLLCLAVRFSALGRGKAGNSAFGCSAPRPFRQTVAKIAGFLQQAASRSSSWQPATLGSEFLPGEPGAALPLGLQALGARHAALHVTVTLC